MLIGIKLSMLSKIKKLSNTKDNKRLLSNFFSLSILQAANYILPLLTLPYLVRVLGIEYFGLLAFATASIAFFNLLTEYGFNLTATREISIHRDDKTKVIEIFSSVMIIKTLLMIFSFIILLLIINIFSKFSYNSEIYIYTFGTVIGQMLFPVWFFQGIEKMKYITYLNILTKIIFTILIFVFIQKESDYYLVPILTSLGFIISGIISIILIFKKFNIYFLWQDIDTLKYYIKESSKVFIGMISYSMINTTTLFILGLLTNNTVVGYYSAVEKLIRAVAMLVNPLSQTLYPYLSKLYINNKEKAFTFSFKAMLYYLIFCFINLIILFLMGEFILKLLYGDFFINKEVLIIYNILIFYPLIYGIVHIFCTQTLLIRKEYKTYKSILFIYFLLNIVIGYLVIINFQAIGASILTILIELLIMITSLYYIYKKKG